MPVFVQERSFVLTERLMKLHNLKLNVPTFEDTASRFSCYYGSGRRVDLPTHHDNAT